MLSQRWMLLLSSWLWFLEGRCSALFFHLGSASYSDSLRSRFASSLWLLWEPWTESIYKLGKRHGRLYFAVLTLDVLFLRDSSAPRVSCCWRAMAPRVGSAVGSDSGICICSGSWRTRNRTARDRGGEEGESSFLDDPPFSHNTGHCVVGWPLSYCGPQRTHFLDTPSPPQGGPL